jgi:exosortase/archaeosortase family protein
MVTTQQPAFSFLILTFNDDMHVGRLLDSISQLNAPTYILDSGSTDRTLEICNAHGAALEYHPFENHPKQWHEALSRFQIRTPWVITLDADQFLSPELLTLLQAFDNKRMSGIDGIYFNRRNYYKGKWIRHGGYYPFYMLKMFRVNMGFSDLNENMDHRFIVPGKTCIWKRGYLIEENKKESSVQFWLDKHGRYSSLLAQEEVERMLHLRVQASKPKLLGSPNERKALLKLLWWQLPRYVRPLLYFSYRMIIQRGFLDGRTGIIFHFLQGFWFRLIVDIKIEEILQAKTTLQMPKKKAHFERLFMLKFLMLFTVLYGFILCSIAITSPGGIYVPWLEENLNYIQAWRRFDLQATATLLRTLGYQTKLTAFTLVVPGHAGFKLVYSCLGYGLMSFYTAFILAWPKSTAPKAPMILIGILVIQLLNLFRFVCISLYWKPTLKANWLDHHTLFNSIVYALTLCALYWWTKKNQSIKPLTYGTHNLNKEL